ncbi:GPO family capsid scaffolding protein [Vreelandella sp. H-I2]
MPWHRIATEGATTDGRNIDADWLTKMAANFNPAKYGCRISLEHIKGILPDSPFKAYGDVTALKTEKGDEGKVELFAEIDPTDELKAMVKNRQKIYTSMEVDPDFSDTGEPRLVGLAVTDTPASLGTTMLQFSAGQGKESPFTNRKQRPENLFTAATVADLDFTEEETPKPGISDFVKSLFSRQDAKTNKGFEAFGADIQSAFEEFAKRHDAMNTELESRPTAEAFSQLKKDHDALKKSFDELYTQLDKTPDTSYRAPATGGDAVQETDC